MKKENNHTVTGDEVWNQPQGNCLEGYMPIAWARLCYLDIISLSFLGGI